MNDKEMKKAKKKQKGLLQGISQLGFLVSDVGRELLENDIFGAHEELEAQQQHKQAVDSLLNEAESLLEMSNFTESEERLKKALHRDKTNERARKIYMKLYIKQRQPQEALKHFVEKDKRVMRNLNIWQDQGEVFFHLGKYSSCKKIFETLRQTSNSSSQRVQASCSLAWVNLIDGDYAAALENINSVSGGLLTFKQIAAAQESSTLALSSTTTHLSASPGTSFFVKAIKPAKRHTRMSTRSVIETILHAKTEEIQLLEVYIFAVFLKTLAKGGVAPKFKNVEFATQAMQDSAQLVKRTKQLTEASTVIVSESTVKIIMGVKEFLLSQGEQQIPTADNFIAKYITEHLHDIPDFWTRMSLLVKIAIWTADIHAVYSRMSLEQHPNKAVLADLFYSVSFKCYDKVLRKFPFDVTCLLGKIRLLRLKNSGSEVCKEAQEEISYLLLKTMRNSPKPNKSTICSSPIHHAAFMGQSESVREILQRGKGTLTQHNIFGQTPLHLACLRGFKDIVTLASDFTGRDCLGFSALHYASMGGHLSIIEFLIPKGCPLIEEKSITPLHLAIEFGRSDIAHYLIELPNLKKPSFEIRDQHGRTALHWTVIYEDFAILENLIKKGCNINTKDAHGNTPLHIAVEYNKIRIVHHLLHNGSSLLLKNNEGLTPRQLAANCKQIEIENILTTAETSNLYSSTRVSVRKAKNSIKNLIFQGGGVKGIAYVGAMKRLAEILGSDFSTIERVGGASAGAINAVIFALGYSVEEMKNMLSELNFLDFLDDVEFREDFFNLKDNSSLKSFVQDGGTLFKIYKGLKQSYGLFEANFLIKWVEGMIYEKTGLNNATFKELVDLKKSDPIRYKAIRQIYVVGTNMTTGATEIFSAEHTPNMIISDAIRISMAIPFLFKPHQFYIKNMKGERVVDPNKLDNYYVDGGLLDNYPIWLFDQEKYLEDEHLHQMNPMLTGTTTASKSGRPVHEYIFNYETLGLKLVSSNKKNVYENNEQLTVNPVKNLITFILNVVNCFYEKQESDHMKTGDVRRTIYINTGEVSTADFDLDTSKKEQLVLGGETGVNEFLKRNENFEKYGISTSEMSLSPKLIQIMAPYFKNYTVSYNHGKGMTIRNLNVQENPKLLFEICNTIQSTEIEFIQQMNLNWNTTDQEGNNCLHYATMQSQDKVISMLIKEFKVYRFAVNTQGESALDLALQIANAAHKRRVIGKLVKHGVFISKDESSVQEVYKTLVEMLEFSGSSDEEKSLREYCDFHGLPFQKEVETMTEY